MELFATCGTGLEAILGQELRGLGMDEVRPLTGGVAFSADLEQAYTALLWSRVASRILLVLERVEATDSDSLYAGVRGIAWEVSLPRRDDCRERPVAPTTSCVTRAIRRCA